MKAKVKTWLRNIENGNIRNNTEVVLNEVKKNTPTFEEEALWNASGIYQGGTGISTYELRESLGMSHQTLTSRLSNLQDEGIIKVVSQTVVNDTDYSVYMFVKELSYRKQLITLRKKEKYVKWLKNADDYMEFMGYKTVQMICYEQQNEGL